MPSDNKPNVSAFGTDSPLYAKYRPRYPAELFSYLAGTANARDLAWDAATGSGQAASGLSPLFKKVIASDLSPEQLASAEQPGNVEYRAGPAETVSLEDGSLDLVTVASAIHWLDLDSFYPVVRRALKAGGVFACFGYDAIADAFFLGSPRMREIMEARYAGPVSPYRGASSRSFGPDYAGLPFPFKDIAPPRFTMELNWTLADFLGYLGTLSATKRHRRETGTDALEKLGEELAPLWGGEKRRIEASLRLRVGVNSPSWQRS